MLSYIVQLSLAIERHVWNMRASARAVGRARGRQAPKGLELPLLLLLGTKKNLLSLLLARGCVAFPRPRAYRVRFLSIHPHL